MEKAILEWRYNPSSYFENEIILDNDQIKLRISAGLVQLELKNYNSTIELTHNKYNNYIESFFISQMIEQRTSYEIKNVSTVIEHEDCSREIYVKPETTTHILRMPLRNKIVKIDKDGKIIYDPDEEEKKRQLDLSTKIQNVLDKDKIVHHLLESYQNSIKFPNDELVYLYEIKDAIKTYFKNKSTVLILLKISDADWSELGIICNKLPLKQGRHRGQMIGKLIDPKENELEKARSIAKNIIKSFINYLNHKNAL